MPLKVYLFTLEVVIKCGTSDIVTKNTRTHRANAVQFSTTSRTLNVNVHVVQSYYYTYYTKFIFVKYGRIIENAISRIMHKKDQSKIMLKQSDNYYFK
jgi:hypothetical protein